MNYTCTKCGKPFDYTPRKQEAGRNRKRCPNPGCHYWNEIKNSLQIANPLSPGQNAAIEGEKNSLQIANPLSPGQNAPSIANPENKAIEQEAKIEDTITPGETLDNQSLQRGYFLLEAKVNAYFKAKHVTPFDLKFIKYYTSDAPESLTKIAKRLNATRQYLYFRRKRLVKLRLIQESLKSPGFYEKNLKFLWWADPELKAKIKGNVENLQVPSRATPAVIKKPKQKPKARITEAPARLTVEMHDPLFRLIPDDLAAYKARESISVFVRMLSKNNPIREIPDALLDNFGRDVLHRKNYSVRVFTGGLNVYLYPNDGTSFTVALDELKTRGEVLKAKLEALYGLKFHWQCSFGEAIKKHPLSMVLKPDLNLNTAAKQTRPVQVAVTPLVTSTTAPLPKNPGGRSNRNAGIVVKDGIVKQTQGSSRDPIITITQTPVQPVAPAIPIPAQTQNVTLNIQDLVKIFLLAGKQQYDDLLKIAVIASLGTSDGSDRGGLESKNPMVCYIADQYTKIGELQSQIKAQSELLKTQSEIIQQLMENQNKFMAQMVRMFQEPNSKESKPKPVPAGSYT